MHRRLVAAAMAGVFSLSLGGPLHASPFHHNAPEEKTTAAKMVSFSLRNDSKEDLLLQVGEKQVSVAPGKTVKLKLAAGAPLTTVHATATRAAGSILTTVSPQLEGNTLAVS